MPADVMLRCYQQCGVASYLYKSDSHPSWTHVNDVTGLAAVPGISLSTYSTSTFRSAAPVKPTHVSVCVCACQRSGGAEASLSVAPGPDGPDDRG